MPEIFKTLECKVTLSPLQTSIFEETLQICDYIWNKALECILEYHQFKWYIWLEKTAKKTKLDIEGITQCCVQFSRKSAWSATCKIAYIKDDQYIPVGIRLLEKITPRLKGDNAMSMSSYFTIKNINTLRQADGLEPLPKTFHSDWVGGLLERLAESWKAYKAIDRRDSSKPKFKVEKLNTLSKSLYTNQSSSIKRDIKTNSIIPNTRLGKVAFVGNSILCYFAKHPNTSIRSVVLKKEPSGYYVCLTVKETIEEKIISVNKKPILGLDPGVKNLWTDDVGNFCENPQFLKITANEIKTIQQKIERQLAHADNKDKKQSDCKNVQKSRKKLARLHEKLRRQRKSFQQHQVHHLSERASEIKLEDFKPKNTIRKPKPKLNEDGSYAKNKRKAKAGLNRVLSDSAIGQFKSLLKIKCDSKGVKVELIPAHHTSQKCSNCGHTHKDNRKTQKVFLCLQCGHNMNADHNAAINIKNSVVDKKD